jgi:vacuolar-type H+-ATPase subunit H
MMSARTIIRCAQDAERELLQMTEEIVGGKRRKNLRATAAGRKLLGQVRDKLHELASEVLDDRDGRNLRKQR